MTALATRLALGASMLLGLSAVASAEAPATARLVSCGGGDCLLVRGHRASSASVIRINDRPVVVHGRRAWSTRVPVASIRTWSTAFARTIAVAVVDPAGGIERSDAVRLPVGLLGHDVELASLVVRAR